MTDPVAHDGFGSSSQQSRRDEIVTERLQMSLQLQVLRTLFYAASDPSSKRTEIAVQD